MYISDVLDSMELFTPVRWAFEFDNVGLLLGATDAKVSKGVVCLDLSSEAIDYAESIGAELIVTHHPSIFQPIKRLVDNNVMSKNLLRMATKGMAHIAAHTNWDAAPFGVNDTLAKILGLEEVEPFGSVAEVQYCKIIVFTPEVITEAVIDAMAEAGAGFVGNYRRCAFKSAGIGTFEPLPGSNPSIGRIGKSDEVPEDRIEMICPTRIVDRVIERMRSTHTYEQPSFDILELKPLKEQPVGRIGVLPEPMLLFQMHEFLKERLGVPPLLWGNPDTTVQRIAVVGGSADEEWRLARRAGADLFVTGEVKHHNALEMSDSGFCVAAAGHFATENPGMRSMQEQLSIRLPGIEWSFFEPRIGFCARPVDA